MTKRQIERRLASLGLRLERDGRGWIVRPNTVGSCPWRSVVELRSLTEAAELVDMREIASREDMAMTVIGSLDGITGKPG